MATHPPGAGAATLEERGAARQGAVGRKAFPGLRRVVAEYMKASHVAALSFGMEGIWKTARIG